MEKSVVFGFLNDVPFYKEFDFLERAEGFRDGAKANMETQQIGPGWTDLTALTKAQAYEVKELLDSLL